MTTSTGMTADATPPPASIVFDGRCFCFTGAMVSLKRSVAEREVRARNGQATDRVNAQLDYLVIGDTPSAGWAHGSYGRKIETALGLRAVEGGNCVW